MLLYLRAIKPNRDYLSVPYRMLRLRVLFNWGPSLRTVPSIVLTFLSLAFSLTGGTKIVEHNKCDKLQAGVTPLTGR